MGRMLIGRCSCGYKSEAIYHGTGMCGGEPNADIPIVCLGCGSLFAANAFLSPLTNCTKCSSSDILPTMRMTQVGTGVTAWRAEPIGGPFPCPKCKRWMMAIDEGQWD
jgi:hypothetical protein